MFATFKISIFFGIVVALLAQQTSATTVKMCVEDSFAERKCQKMAEKVKDVVVECLLNAPCKDFVKSDKADFLVIDADEHTDVLNDLEPVLYESFDDDNVVVAVVKADKESKVNELPLEFNDKDLREVHGAFYLNHYRLNGVCQKVQPAAGVETIKIVRYPNVKDKTDKKLVCVENKNVVTKSFDDYKKCNVEANIPNAVMVKKNSDKKNVVVKIMMDLVENKFDDFKLFGVFEEKNNVLFSDDTKEFVKEHPAPNGVTVKKFLDLHCGNVKDYH